MMTKTALLLTFFCFSITISIAQNALNFDGSTDYVQTNSPGVTGTNNRTFEAWVYVSSNAPLSNLCIIDYGTNALGSRNTFMVAGNRALSFISGGTNANISSNANDVPADTWVHVAFVLNSGTGYLYLNGVQVGTGSLTSVNTPTGNQNVIIGQRVSGGSIPFYGNIDEVRMWNVARTPTEIQADMNSEICTGSPNLKLYMPMNQGVAGGNNSGLTSAIDYSGNGVSGTLFNFSLSGNTSNWVQGVNLTPGMNGSVTQESACHSYTWSANGQTYNTSGVYAHTLTNTYGCDSIATLNLTISSPSNVTTNQVVCDSFAWNVSGQTYYATTTEVENLTNSSGCQYTHTLNLTVNNSFHDVEIVESCGAFTWDVNGQSYTIPGIYTESFSTIDGCDSIHELDLQVSIVNAVAVDNGDSTISANISGATYQWIDCDNGNAVISGETNQNIQVESNGNYAVIITEGNCSDTSDCIAIDYLSVQNMDHFTASIAPNPAASQVVVTLSNSVDGTLELLDANGRIIQTTPLFNEGQKALQLTYEPGIYIVRIKTNDGQIQQEKLIIH